MKASAGRRGQFGANTGRSDRTITCGPTTWRDAVPYVQAAFDAGCRRFQSAEVEYLAFEVDPSAEGAGGRWSVAAQDAEVPARSEHYLRRWTVAQAVEVLAFFGFTVPAEQPPAGD